MSSAKAAIVWLRQDLRTQDNECLQYAQQNKMPIIPIYIHDDKSAGDWKMGSSSKWWLQHSLTELSQTYQNANHKLRFYKGNTVQILDKLVKLYGADCILYNRCYERHHRMIDKDLLKTFKNDNVKMFNGNVLYAPENMKTKGGKVIQGATAYYNQLMNNYDYIRAPIKNNLSENVPFTSSQEKIEEEVSLSELNLINPEHDTSLFSSWWTPGEKEGMRRLQEFIGRVGTYKNDRKNPADHGTSRLSPHYHFGEVTPFQVWYKVFDESKNQKEEGINHYIFEVAWREFYSYTMFYNPNMADQNMIKKFDNLVWNEDPGDLKLKAWKEGRTGIPIVDAGMRELLGVGYIHNTTRLIVANFLIKGLMIDWRKGEEHFWEHLVDADLPSNAGGWQWSAGTHQENPGKGVQISNPYLQSSKYDPKGDYIRKWVPELRKMPTAHIHDPSEAPENVLEKAGVEIGITYPYKIVNHNKVSKEARIKWEKIYYNK